LRGAMLSLIAIILPPLLVLIVDRIYRRLSHLPAVDGFVHGLSLGVIGIFAVVLIQLLRGGPMDIRTGAFVLAGIALAAIPRFPVSLIIVLAAIAGLLLH
jgi:chromate transporter